MSEPTFQIVFRGKILSGFDRAQVRVNLAQLFRTDPARIDAMLDAPKTVLKTGLSKDAAARYQEALRQAGIMVAAIGEGNAVEIAVRPATPTAAEASTPVVARAAVANEVQAEPAADANAVGLTLAPPGERILPPVIRPKAEIDTSALTLAQAGAVLVDRQRVVNVRQYDLSGISIATGNDPIDATPKPPPAAIDISALTLAEVPAQVEKAPTELQKLLSSSVE